MKQLKNTSKTKKGSRLTFKVKHSFDFSEELRKAKQVAEWAASNKYCTNSKFVKHIGMKSDLSNQLLKKYGRCKPLKEVKNVKIIVPGRACKLLGNSIKIVPLKVEFEYQTHIDHFDKICQIEIDEHWFYISILIREQPNFPSMNFIGVDMNSTGFCAVAACPATGKILKLGKKSNHIRQKYKSLRKKFGRKKKFGKLKQIKNRQRRICEDVDHKVSRDIVNFAKENNCHIKLENLQGITRNKGGKKNLSYTNSSWSFYRLKQFIEYKSKLLGVSVFYVDPYMTSQTCSRCGLIGKRTGKFFESPIHGVEHADVNAAFEIALRPVQLAKERVLVNGSTDTPKLATVRTEPTKEPTLF